MTTSLSFRPAGPGDLPFIWHLRQTTMREMIEASYGWVEETQYEYAKESLSGEIVLLDENRVGVLTLSDWKTEMHLVWMAILPGYQGQGFGSQLLNRAKRTALAARKPLTLQVLTNNPAIDLYLKHGFVAYDTNGPHKILMRFDGFE